MNYNQTSQNNLKPSFKIARLVHLALLAGQVLFAGVTLFINKNIKVDTSRDNQFLIIALILAIMGFFVGNLIYKQVVNVAAKKETFVEKMMAYQSALIIRYALLEGASLFCIVSYFLTSNFIFLLISGAIIVYFIILRPKVDTIAEELNLTYEEKAELENS